LNNLKQWGLAQNMYVDDNNQTFPMTKIPDGTPGAPAGYDEDTPDWNDLAYFYKAGQGNSAWFNALPPYVSSKPLYYYAAILSDGINVYNTTPSIYQCPSAKIDPSLNVDIRVVFQYGMNSKGLYGNYGTTSIPVLKTGVIKNPSAFAMFSDNRVRIADEPSYDKSTTTLGSPQNYTSRLSMRHNLGANITFSDGHAVYYKYVYAVVDNGGKPSDPGRPDINWGYDGTSVDGIGMP
jgi:prepilin-type processing-associated H-X9-DG protein